LNATNGAFLWSYTTGNSVTSSPAVVDGRVYVGSLDNRVYALNATNGAFLWSYTTGNSVTSSPAVAGSRVYVGSGDDNVYDFGPLPLSVTISPDSATLNVDQSQLFTSSVTGGISPYTYQWYLNDAPVSGATNFTWTFTPALPGSYTIFVVVNDSATPPTSVQSNKAPVTALSAIVYIMNDGSVVPSYAPISSLDKVTYTFTGNISYPAYYGIVVERSNILIDGKGYVVQGNQSGTGISLASISNVAIKNTNIKGFSFGIHLYSSSGNTISANNVTANGNGIWLVSSSGNTISANNVTANGNGIWLVSSSGNTISANNVTANSAYGIWLVSSSGNVLSGNVMAGNTFNFGVYGDVLNDFVNYVDASNLVDSKPVFYLMNRSNIVISPTTYPEGVGYLSLVNCANVTVQGLTLTKNLQGLLLANTTDSKITDENITANGRGIWLVSSSGNTISANNVTANGDGIWLVSSSDNNITTNKIANNNFFGLLLQSASNNNIVYHNSFIGNYAQASTDSMSIGNTWNDTYPSGGNYWSDYTDVDQKRGPNQDQLGSDGIGDTRCVIDLDNQDHYPLMKAYGGAYDIGMASITKSRTIVGRGLSLNLSVKVVNYGIYSETFNATIYANTTIIVTFRNITLTSRNSTTITFTWNTTDFAKGKYAISTYVTPVPDETDSADNNCTGGSMSITEVGDLGGYPPGSHVAQFFICDGSCGPDDMQLFIQCYRGTAPPEAMYLGDLGSGKPVPQFFKFDGKVDFQDIPLFLRCYRGQGPDP
jgi:parallel beta-helix repeat protein